MPEYGSQNSWFVLPAFGVFLVPFLGALLGIESLVSFVASDMFLPLTVTSVGMTAFALLMSVTHLGKPWRFFRGFNNIRYSPKAREGLGLAMFAAGCGLTALFSLPGNQWVVEFTLANLGLDLIELTAGLPLDSLVTGAGISEGRSEPCTCIALRSRGSVLLDADVTGKLVGILIGGTG